MTNQHTPPRAQVDALNAITVPIVNAYRTGVLSNAGAQAILTFFSANPAATTALNALGGYTAALGPVLTTATVRCPCQPYRVIYHLISRQNLTSECGALPMTATVRCLQAPGPESFHHNRLRVKGIRAWLIASASITPDAVGSWMLTGNEELGNAPPSQYLGYFVVSRSCLAHADMPRDHGSPSACLYKLSAEHAFACSHAR